MKATKQVAGKLKLELAQFRELAAFAQFGSDLDAKTKAQLDRGARIVELFKQPAFNPIAIEMQAAILWGMQNNFYDDIDASKMVAASNSLQDFFSGRKEALLTKIREVAKIDDGIASELKAAYEEWKPGFEA